MTSEADRISRWERTAGKPALGAFKPVEKRLAEQERLARRQAAVDGAPLLDECAAQLARYVAFPTEHALVAVTLWAAHAHALDAFESTPRLASLSPEKGSGKTRTLEVLEELVPNAMHAVNCTAAALFRAVSASRSTVLFDECDTYFGPRVAQHHEELRGLINAGHRRGAVAYRCVGEGAKQEVKAFPAFAAVALAGIGDLPDTILDRAVVIRMRRRSPSEHVEPFRRRLAVPALHDIRSRLSRWAKRYEEQLREADPPMPPGITDRPADVWEALLAVADVAGGRWPQRARAAALALNAERLAADPSLGVRLLSDLKEIFGTAETMATETILERLVALDEAPWADIRGKPLDARSLAQRLRRFEVRPGTVRIGAETKKGYKAEDLHDAWLRYLPPLPPPAESVTSVTATQPQVTGLFDVTDEVSVTDPSVTTAGAVTDSEPLTSTCDGVTDVTLLQAGEEGAPDYADHRRWTR